MPTIDIRIKDKIAMRTGGEAFIVRDNSDYVINFTFDAEWAEETAKTARFALQGGGYMDVPFTGSSVAVPVISTGRRVDVGVFAGNLRTTTSATLPLVPSIRSKGGAPVPPEDAVYDKLIALINSMGEISDDDIKQAVEDYLSANPIAAASMRVEAGYIQFSADGKTWTDIIAISNLKGSPGKDGTTPHIGDNGNWYIGSTDTGNPSRGATGAKGDAGAPGKDGAGMDITGATVGQIAKIAAVDASGVPTAWSPVDMPSAESETMDLSWKHIRDVELTPDAIEAIVSTTDAGNTFSYDEIMLEFIPNLEGYFYVRASQSANLSKNVAVWVTNSKYTQMHLGLLGKKLAITSAFRIDGSLGFANNYGGNGDIDKISTVVFGASASVGAAFTVKIWGR